MLALQGLGRALSGIQDYVATVFLIVAYGVGISLFMRHLRPRLSTNRKVFATALLVLTPLPFLLLAEAGHGTTAAFEGLAIGGMAASAWASTFPRARVGGGALMVVAASLIALAWPVSPLAWPLLFVGNLVLATGVTGELRSRTA